MQMTHPVGTLILALPASNTLEELHFKALRSCVMIARSLHTVVQPVTVQYRDESVPDEGLIHSEVSSNDRSLLLPLRSINCPRSSTSARAEALHQYAVSSGARLICAATHGRSGLETLLQASFAEELVMNSPVPVLSMNPNSRPLHRISRILFPTDLGPNSKLVLDRLIPLARETGAEITLLHFLRHPKDLELERDVVPYDEIRSQLPAAWIQENKIMENQAELLADHARLNGARITLSLPVSSIALPDAIEIAAETGEHDLIACASDSGRIQRYFDGMITTSLLRHSSRPVWALHETLEIKATPAA